MRRSFSIAVGSISLFVQHAFAAEVIGSPYLQSTTSHSTTVAWMSSESIPTRLMYFDGADWRRITEDTPKTLHSLPIESLIPSTSYQYQVLGANNEMLFSGAFKTFPELNSSTPIHFAVFGDSGSGDGNQRDVARQVDNWTPDFILHTGDVVYDHGELKDYPKKFLQPYASMLHRIPLFPTIGNHDEENIQDYLSIFSLPAISARSNTERYYSFDYGAAHFSVLDVTADYRRGSAQSQWLIEDLARAKELGAKWLIGVIHSPPFSAGLHGDEEDVQDEVLPIFEAAKVDLVFSGDDHAYQRTEPINWTKQNAHRITYIVTGGGGRVLYPRLQPWDRRIDVYKMKHHFVGVNIIGDRLTGTAIDKKGAVIDQFTLSKVSVTKARSKGRPRRRRKG